MYSQIKSGHQTIGMRILTVYFSLEGCQAYTKKSESKEIKGIKINFEYNACCHWLKERESNKSREHRAELKLSRHLPNCIMSDLFRDFFPAFLSLIESEIAERASKGLQKRQAQ